MPFRNTISKCVLSKYSPQVASTAKEKNTFVSILICKWGVSEITGSQTACEQRQTNGSNDFDPGQVEYVNFGVQIYAKIERVWLHLVKYQKW